MWELKRKKSQLYIEGKKKPLNTESCLLDIPFG